MNYQTALSKDYQRLFGRTVGVALISKMSANCEVFPVVDSCCFVLLSDKYRQMQVRIWWRHQMETLSVFLALCVGNSPVTGEFPLQRPVTRSFDVFFDLCLKNGWISNHKAGDLICHRASYDVTVIGYSVLNIRAQLPIVQKQMSNARFNYNLLSASVRRDSFIKVSYLAGVAMGFQLIQLHNCDPNIYWCICGCLETYFTEKCIILIHFSSGMRNRVMRNKWM